MKKRKNEDMTLREKIGQTAVFRHMLLDEFDDINEVEKYFSNNPYGATWPMNHPKEVYRAFEKPLGAANDPDLAYRYGKTIGEDVHSIGVSFGSPDMFFNYFTAANTYANCLNPITYTNDVY